MAPMQVRSQLRLFQDALLQLLHRDPRRRPSMQQFCSTCASILGEHAPPTVNNSLSVRNSNSVQKDTESTSRTEAFWHTCTTWKPTGEGGATGRDALQHAGHDRG
jgi:hypothetical protein